jgi:hypothetical protein
MLLLGPDLRPEELAAIFSAYEYILVGLEHPFLPWENKEPVFHDAQLMRSPDTD